MLEHKSFLKIPRLHRDITITEKIDGTNGAIGILTQREPGWESHHCTRVSLGGLSYGVYAQSRSSLLEWRSPIGLSRKPADNYGFGQWVHENAETLVTDLGPGLHFGEWWGHGINRGYGYKQPGARFFALFNTKRWENAPFSTRGLMTVPVIYQGSFGASEDGLSPVEAALADLREHGSIVAMDEHYEAEGIVIYHHAANTLFKVTLLNDDKPKGQEG